jgi:hypothetical protein
MDFIFFKSSWIPAYGGMAKKNHAFLMFVSPAKAGVQFEALKGKVLQPVMFRLLWTH